MSPSLFLEKEKRLARPGKWVLQLGAGSPAPFSPEGPVGCCALGWVWGGPDSAPGTVLKGCPVMGQIGPGQPLAGARHGSQAEYIPSGKEASLPAPGSEVAPQPLASGWAAEFLHVAASCVVKG